MIKRNRFFWELVKSEWIVSGHLYRDSQHSLKIEDLNILLFANHEWHPVQMPIDSIVGKWLMDDYLESMSIRSDDHSESFRSAK